LALGAIRVEQAARAEAVHGMAEYTKRFGEPGGSIQADMMLRGGD
jgi:hypothetical protein